jgi:hypothetical protein
MLPAFRSKASVLSFCALLITLLLLPLVTNWVGHPPREQAYAGMEDTAGLVGVHVREMFRDPGDPDVLVLGSSLVTAGVDAPTVERALSQHLGRQAHVEILGLNWQGVDLQYFLLRDYLAAHHPKLIIWNPPFPGSRDIEPHLKAYHWVRYGEYSEALTGLSLRYRMTLYGEMVLGAPRELLSHLRRNRVGEDELHARLLLENTGYYGRPFVPQSIDSLPLPSLQQTYEEAPYTLVNVTGKPLNPYEYHFAQEILKLTKGSKIPLALIYIPTDIDLGKQTIPERNDFPELLHMNAPLIGAPAAALFQGMDKDHFDNFYRDQHLNSNGNRLYTQSILPAVLKAYDEKDQHE